MKIQCGGVQATHCRSIRCVLTSLCLRSWSQVCQACRGREKGPNVVHLKGLLQCTPRSSQVAEPQVGCEGHGPSVEIKTCASLQVPDRQIVLETAGNGVCFSLNLPGDFLRGLTLRREMESDLERAVGLRVTVGLLPSFNQPWPSCPRIFAQVFPPCPRPLPLPASAVPLGLC